jgi:hypothetical protein
MLGRCIVATVPGALLVVVVVIIAVVCLCSAFALIEIVGVIVVHGTVVDTLLALDSMWAVGGGLITPLWWILCYRSLGGGTSPPSLL